MNLSSDTTLPFSSIPSWGSSWPCWECSGEALAQGKPWPEMLQQANDKPGNSPLVLMNSVLVMCPGCWGTPGETTWGCSPWRLQAAVRWRQSLFSKYVGAHQPVNQGSEMPDLTRQHLPAPSPEALPLYKKQPLLWDNSPGSRVSS